MQFVLSVSSTSCNIHLTAHSYMCFRSTRTTDLCWCYLSRCERRLHINHYTFVPDGSCLAPCSGNCGPFHDHLLVEVRYSKYPGGLSTFAGWDL